MSSITEGFVFAGVAIVRVRVVVVVVVVVIVDGRGWLLLLRDNNWWEISVDDEIFPDHSFCIRDYSLISSHRCLKPGIDLFFISSLSQFTQIFGQNFDWARPGKEHFIIFIIFINFSNFNSRQRPELLNNYKDDDDHLQPSNVGSYDQQFHADVLSFWPRWVVRLR